MATLQGSWIWYELVTNDPAGAKAFYEAVVGWQITPGTAETNGYGFLGNADNRPTGGMLPITPEMAEKGARPGWLGYIGVDDCDKAVAAVEAAGGKICMPPTDIPMAGRIAMVSDCCGALFYVMTPNMPAGSGPSTAFSRDLPGRCSWNELQASEPARAIAFYTGLFGWTLPEPMDMGEWGKYQFIEHDGVGIGAIMRNFVDGVPPHWNHYFRVADIDVAVKTVEAQGGQVVNGPHQVPTGEWILHGHDSQGGFFSLVSAKGTQEAPGA